MRAAMARSATVAFFLLLLLCLILTGTSRNLIRLPSDRAAEVLAPADADGSGDEDAVGTRSAVLIPGSNGYNNRRHQAAVNQWNAVNQRDASLLYFWYEYFEAPLDSSQKQDALKELVEVLSRLLHIDNSIELIGKLLFGSEQGSKIIKTVRPEGQPFVDDRSCLKSMVMIFEMHCGSLSKYRLKHIRSLANICNAGVSVEKMAEVSAQACSSIPCSR